MASSGSTSKKRSGASSPSKPPVAQMLSKTVSRKEACATRSAAVATSTSTTTISLPMPRMRTWLTAVGNRGWIVLTKDRRIRYRNLERAALMAANVGAFIRHLWRPSRRRDRADFCQALPTIYDCIANHRKPFIAKVARTARVIAVRKQSLRIAKSIAVEATFVRVLDRRQFRPDVWGSRNRCPKLRVRRGPLKLQNGKFRRHHTAITIGWNNAEGTLQGHKFGINKIAVSSIALVFYTRIPSPIFFCARKTPRPKQ